MPGESDDSPDSTSYSASSRPSQQAQQTLASLANSAHLKQKRARSQLSCIPCRQGKLKCDRSHDPACDQCVKRNRESSCLYLPPPTKQKPAHNVKGRIRQLENLVVDLMNQQGTKSGHTSENGEEQRRKSSIGDNTGNGASRTVQCSRLTPPSDNDSSPQNNASTVWSGDGQDDVEGATKPFGQMRIGKEGVSYVGEAHWQAILNGISDLKRDLEDDEGEQLNSLAEEDDSIHNVYGNSFGNIPPEELQFPIKGGAQPASSTGLAFMLGSSSSVTREQLISAIPEKRKADRLLSLWFNSPDPFKPIIHAPTFQDEYRRFWKDPKQTPTMWLGLLYAILSIAASFGLRDVDPSSSNAKAVIADVNGYHTLCASAAVMADFTKPKPYTIECLILYTAGLRSNDAFVNVWLMIGLIIRLCLRMGYHRDPGSYPGISTFQGEMRRRVWAIISMIDSLISFQLGLPSMVKTIQSDALPPRNLLDRDFNVDTKELPPNRGIDELTPSSYTRAKLRIVRIFADAAELSHQTIPPTIEEIAELDLRLDEAKAAVPPLLQMPDISELVTDPAEQLMCRFNLDLLFLKTKMVLHRRYMERPFASLTPEEQFMGIGKSRKICTSCALRVLQHHQTIYSASQAGGQLESVKWYMGSISTHDFLLAAMIICLELSQQIGNLAALNPAGTLCPYRMAMMDALEKSQKIWSDASGRKRRLNQFVGKDEHARGEHMFDETDKASRAMAVMLEKVKSHFPQQAQALAKYNEQENSAQQLSIKDRLGVPTPVYRSSNEFSYGGIISNHQWGDMNDVVPQADFYDVHAATAAGPFTNGSNSTNGASYVQPFSQYATPPQTGTAPDFSILGDMLDMGANIDWEMFDSGVNTKGKQSQSNATNTSQGLQDMEDISMLGNSLMGGSGTVENILAGNVMVFGGTGPGSAYGSGTFTGDVAGGADENGGGQVYPGSWMSFQDMDDVDLDLAGYDGIAGNKGPFFSLPEQQQQQSQSQSTGGTWRSEEVQ